MPPEEDEKKAISETGAKVGLVLIVCMLVGMWKLMSLFDTYLSLSWTRREVSLGDLPCGTYRVLATCEDPRKIGWIYLVQLQQLNDNGLIGRVCSQEALPGYFTKAIPEPAPAWVIKPIPTPQRSSGEAEGTSPTPGQAEDGESGSP